MQENSALVLESLGFAVKAFNVIDINYTTKTRSLTLQCSLLNLRNDPEVIETHLTPLL